MHGEGHTPTEESGMVKCCHPCSCPPHMVRPGRVNERTDTGYNGEEKKKGCRRWCAGMAVAWAFHRKEGTEGMAECVTWF